METPHREDFESDKPAQEIIPDGGLKAWLTVVGGWLALFVTWGYANSFGVYQDFYTRTRTSSPSNISWIGSVQLFFFFAMGLPAGKLLDKGYFRAVMLTGSFIYIFSLFMLSLAKPVHYYQILLSQGVGMGIGSGLIYLPAIAVQAHHWRRRRALAMGLVATGSSFGGIVYPIMLNHFFASPVGFAWGVRASAFLSLAFIVAANLLMSPRAPSNNIDQKPPSKPKLSSLVTDAPYVIVNLAVFVIVWGLYFPYFYLQLFTVLHGLPTQFAFDTLTIQNAASVLGRTIPNLLADTLGVLNILTLVTFGTGALVFALLGIATIGGVLTFSILYGFFSGAVLSLFAPMMASLARDVSEIGLRMGIAFFVISFAFLTGTPIDGAFLEDGYQWFKPIIFSGTVILAGVPLFIVARCILTKSRQTQRV